MRNYKLLDALEAYLLAEDEYACKHTISNEEQVKEKRSKLEAVIAVETNTEDIKDLIQDLRDYWATLKD